MRKYWHAPKHLLGLAKSRYRRWRSDSWEEYYVRTHTHGDPENWVGGDFETMQTWQVDLLLDEGLGPDDTLLDLGCGILRGGIPFIEYLDAGNYVGMDISLPSLMEGHRRIHANDLEMKRPVLIHNEDLSWLPETDWMLAQSVWSHLPPDRLTDCLDEMQSEIVIATIFTEDREGDPVTEPTSRDFRERQGVDWAYPLDWIAERTTYGLERLNVEHPHGQTVVRLK